MQRWCGRKRVVGIEETAAVIKITRYGHKTHLLPIALGHSSQGAWDAAS